MTLWDAIMHADAALRAPYQALWENTGRIVGTSIGRVTGAVVNIAGEAASSAVTETVNAALFGSQTRQSSSAASPLGGLTGLFLIGGALYLLLRR